MKRFVEEEDRRQATLLPDCLDDYVAPDNPVRIVEAFVATLLKIYLYGYLNPVPSSRRLERETQRNLELMWLTGRLMPGLRPKAPMDLLQENGEHSYSPGGSPCPRHAFRKSFRMRRCGLP